MDPRHYRHGRRQATRLWRGAHGVPWPGVARFPILLKSVEAKSKLYELSPSLSLSFVFETWTSGLFDVLVDGKVAATRSHAERDPPCLLRLSLRERALEYRVSGFFYHRSKVLNLHTANLTATMGRYRNSCVWVCFVPIRKQSFDHPRSGFDTNTAMLPAWSFYDDCLRISSSGFLHIFTLYSWLLNLIISFILQGIRFGILTDGKTLSYQICTGNDIILFISKS